MTNTFLNSEELNQIKSYLHLKNFNLICKTGWGSHNQDYREQIHNELKHLQSKAYPFFDSSISHAKSIGGYAFCQYDQKDVLQIGFDIEASHRVTDSVALRICQSSEEKKEAPSNASLWVAKEAAFKCLKGPHQPQVITSMTLGNWSQTSQFDTVEVLNTQNFSFKTLRGIVFQKVVQEIPHHFCVFVARP